MVIDFQDSIHAYKSTKPITYVEKEVTLGDQLPYGDYRKPSIKTRIKQQCTHNWLAFKMAVRPRARLKSFLKK